MTPKTQTPARRKSLTVKEWLTLRLQLTEKTQTEIAAEVGFKTPNMIAMIKKGVSKLPWNRAGAIAKALGANPDELYRLMLEEYHPEAWQYFEAKGLTPLTSAEQIVLDAFRASGLDDGTEDSVARAKRIAKLIEEAAKAETK